jgi:hypothetical protein
MVSGAYLIAVRRQYPDGLGRTYYGKMTPAQFWTLDAGIAAMVRF